MHEEDLRIHSWSWFYDWCASLHDSNFKHLLECLRPLVSCCIQISRSYVPKQERVGWIGFQNRSKMALTTEIGTQVKYVEESMKKLPKVVRHAAYNMYKSIAVHKYREGEKEGSDKTQPIACKFCLRKMVNIKEDEIDDEFGIKLKNLKKEKKIAKNNYNHLLTGKSKHMLNADAVNMIINNRISRVPHEEQIYERYMNEYSKSHFSSKSINIDGDRKIDTTEQDRIEKMTRENKSSIASKLCCYKWGGHEDGLAERDKMLRRITSPSQLDELCNLREVDFGKENTLIAAASNVRQVACGDTVSLILFDSGVVLQTSGTQMKRINIPYRVMTIACGNRHYAAITETLEEHNLFMWGNNEYGQLGIGTMSSQALTVPKQVKMSDHDIRFAYISLGGDFSVAISTRNHVYVWGKNDKDQLGLGAIDDRHCIPTPTLLLHFEWLSVYGKEGSYESLLSTQKLEYDGNETDWNNEMWRTHRCRLVACGQDHVMQWTTSDKRLKDRYNVICSRCQKFSDDIHQCQNQIQILKSKYNILEDQLLSMKAKYRSRHLQTIESMNDKNTAQVFMKENVDSILKEIQTNLSDINTYSIQVAQLTKRSKNIQESLKISETERENISNLVKVHFANSESLRNKMDHLVSTLSTRKDNITRNNLSMKITELKRRIIIADHMLLGCQRNATGRFFVRNYSIL